ncbi:MAG TPA: ADP-forming succinate--CoA ligase subunit beta [Phycisphaerae bacterium]|nr:ADP-forming succinate--CoA ligase subunit beta [Phycisphaerae bacterium]HOJ76095.1 ADP-forming succinate--CoA ligase subunit beta [Phycisphaerae bacterium]HOM51863.1 ADP-forming succinate--CoA ligase subunit beta [Phycisphaerae bacterium]HOQ87521.1 ADP-forming succinate--CoA ligase subunit beta [Phycisphaerae bacterium]HPP28606.1 ADP-forming succinate--CoA ligase subunit beta [Phycisphaerae bacterium]
MKIHEYQSRRLLADAGVPVPPADVVESVADAVAAHQKIGGRVVVKAQVFAGGRGKAGFVKLCDTPDQTRQAAEFMLTNKMVSKQTGPAGVPVSRLLVAAAVDIAQEYYVGMVVDRARRCPVMMVSREGGVEIEEVAARHPEAIIKEWLHPHLGLQPYQVRKLTQALGFTRKEHVQAAAKVFLGLADVFLRYDASLAEINPLVLTRDGELMAIDAKINFDDNALFRHPDVQAMHDPTEENASELRAKAANLSYIALDGNIGCLVNGAGLAMATMDLIKLHGGEPANFLDVGGSVTREGAVEAFRIILADPKVKGVLVNIFGGIAKCDTIAEALVAAAKEVGFRVPVVVRLEGTNVEKARQILSTADVPGLITAADLTDAAKKVCAAV